jgi:spermidine synthase
MIFRRKIHKSLGDRFPVEVSEKGGVRFLAFGNGTVQSAMRIKRPNELELAYTRAMMGFLLFSRTPRQVLLVGLGGGSLAKFCLASFASVRVVAVEKEPRVVATARAFFAVPPDGDHFHVEVCDGADFVGAHAGGWDVIFVDGYDAGCQVPHLATEDFYRACRRAVAPGGTVVVNLWSSDGRYSEYLDHALAAFDGHILCMPAEKRGNVIVFGFDTAPQNPGWVEWRERAVRLEATYGIEFSRFADAFVARNPHDADGWMFAR